MPTRADEMVQVVSVVALTLHGGNGGGPSGGGGDKRGGNGMVL